MHNLAVIVAVDEGGSWRVSYMDARWIIKAAMMDCTSFLFYASKYQYACTDIGVKKLMPLQKQRPLFSVPREQPKEAKNGGLFSRLFVVLNRAIFSRLGRGYITMSVMRSKKYNLGQTIHRCHFVL